MMKFFERITGVLTAPQNYFERVKKEGFQQPFLFYIVFLVILAIPNSLLWQREMQISSRWLPLLVPAEFVISVLLTLFATWVIQLCLRLVGGKGKYNDTLRASIYGSVPSLLLEIPVSILGLSLTSTVSEIVLTIISLAGVAYTVYLSIIGFSLYHKLSRGMSFVGGVILPVVLVVFTVILIVMILVLFFGLLLAGVAN